MKAKILVVTISHLLIWLKIRSLTITAHCGTRGEKEILMSVQLN